MPIRVKVDGFRELDEALSLLPKATAKNTMRRALRQAAGPMAETMRGMAPVDPDSPGDLAGSIAVSTKLSKRQAKMHRKMFKNDKSAVEMFVGPGPDPAAWNQEFGNINHGPQPFARPAFDAEGEPTLKRLSGLLWQEIKKSVARAERKAARLAAKG